MTRLHVRRSGNGDDVHPENRPEDEPTQSGPVPARAAATPAPWSTPPPAPPQPGPTPAPAPPPAPWSAEPPATPAAEAHEEAAPPTPKARRIPWKRIATVGLVLATLGVFGAGFGVGWAAGSRSVDGAAGETTVEVIAAPTGEGGDLLTLPDVRGLRLVDAQQAITDAGLPLEVVTAEDAPSALPAGTVVSQDPVGGTTDAEAVTLFVAVPGTVPRLVGRTADEARQALLQLGAAFDQEQVYDPAAREGTVLSVDPPAGSPLTGTVTVTVAGPADSVYLAELEAIEGGCGTGESGVNGTQYPQSLQCSVSSYESTTSYLTNRLATSIDATVGIDDTSEAGTAARLVVRGDGRVLARVDVAYGRSTPLSVDTRGVLRVDFVYTAVGESSGYLVLGDARAVGSPDAITTLAGS